MKDDRRSETIRYVTGALVSGVLTLLAFWVVMGPDLARPVRLWVLAGLGLAQIVVQLRCFLHIGWHSRREDLQLILFSLVLLGLMIGGTIWIMGSLAVRMH
ncbi:cytochrome o ubiquinol oxidase subunit IV [Oceaniglobus trochenteri]|uniref:cytochrome o ubiquinol oxidase subunit IV n=1 Tax=Oceaniglobus trochenteri TaxID=2763260 RepID=UPI001CFFC451|nr:cytochrome C oxidase subunit IV family protein [Oceaniglobus trochenteri]